MMEADEIRARLADANLKRVAEKSGIHPATIYRFMDPTHNPFYDTVLALSNYLEKNP